MNCSWLTLGAKSHTIDNHSSLFLLSTHCFVSHQVNHIELLPNTTLHKEFLQRTIHEWQRAGVCVPYYNYQLPNNSGNLTQAVMVKHRYKLYYTWRAKTGANFFFWCTFVYIKETNSNPVIKVLSSFNNDCRGVGWSHHNS